MLVIEAHLQQFVGYDTLPFNDLIHIYFESK